MTTNHQIASGMIAVNLFKMHAFPHVQVNKITNLLSSTVSLLHLSPLSIICIKTIRELRRNELHSIS